jgi:hypothetical protein
MAPRIQAGFLADAIAPLSMSRISELFIEGIPGISSENERFDALWRLGRHEIRKAKPALRTAVVDRRKGEKFWRAEGGAPSPTFATEEVKVSERLIL